MQEKNAGVKKPEYKRAHAKSAMSNDKLYRKLFAHPEMVEDLIKNFVNERFVEHIDFSTLKELKNKYVTDENKYRENDIIYEIKIKNEPVYFYILLEFQSSVDKFMPVRMLTYIMLFYQDLIKKSAARKAKLEKLPAVFPILLYNGEDKWQPLAIPGYGCTKASMPVGHAVRAERLDRRQIQGAREVYSELCIL